MADAECPEVREPRRPSPADFVRLWLGYVEIAVEAVVLRADEREDLVQEICMILLMRFERGPEIENPRAFIRRVAANLSINRARSSEVRRVRNLSDAAARSLQVPPASHPSWVETVEVSCLGERDRSVWQSWCRVPLIKSVARDLRLDVRQVKRALRRIAEHLRDS